MKKSSIIIALSGLLAAGLLNSCDKESIDDFREKVEVIMNGSLPKPPASKTQIVPNEVGLPEKKLDVAIITVNYRTSDPENVQPDLAAWGGSTADITRGYFGGPGLKANPITNGEIKYTNDDGSAVQKVFYDETGEHYFVRVLYPFDNANFVQTDRGAGVLFSDIDGSQDILCSNLGWGNLDTPEVITNEKDSAIIFSHMLSLFRIKLKPESQTAVIQYGEIKNVKLANQSSSIRIDMIDLNTEGSGPFTMDYFPIGFAADTLHYDTINAVPIEKEAGYLMAVPAQKFIFEAQTDRLWVSSELNFATALDPYKTSAPGTIYDVTLKFMEGYEMEIEVEAAEEWWMDSEFN